MQQGQGSGCPGCNPAPWTTRYDEACVLVSERNAEMADGYFKDFWFGNLEGNLSTRYNTGQCAKSRHAINSTAFQRTNNRTAYVNWMLEHKQAINSWYKNPAFVRDESIAVHGKTIREAITLEFGSGALRVLRESQAWFREQTRRFLEEGGDPAF